MIIRDANIADAAQLSEIYGYYVENTCYTFEYVAPPPEECARRVLEAAGRFPFLVCLYNDEIVGFAYAHLLAERKAYQWVCETSIYVKNGATQGGIGGALYSRLLPALKRQGFVKAYALVGCPNEASERFHLRAGFIYEATLKNAGYKHGAWHDVKYYALELNQVRNNIREPVGYYHPAPIT